MRHLNLKRFGYITSSHSSHSVQPHQESKKYLRQKMRLQRRQLTQFEQKKAAKKLSDNFKKFLCRNRRTLSIAATFCKSSSTQQAEIKIGIYSASDGEINPQYLPTQLGNTRIKPYFPIIQKNKTLTYGQKKRRQFPRRNIYMIAEPDRHQSITIKQLDVLLLPVVAASKQGDRLGMGGGYYDRSLAQLNATGKSPLIVGIAHHFQVVETLPSQLWDQPLQAILTDHEIIQVPTCP